MCTLFSSKTFPLLTQEDLIICEYCDEGVHYSCLDPPPEKRPKVWDCDDCLVARGKQPNNNIKKASGASSASAAAAVGSTR